MSDKKFAPEYPRRLDTETGLQDLVDFGSDVNLRKRLFIEESMKHPAKANLNMLGSVISYVSEPDERITDIMAGTGSILIAALAGRPVTLIEISSHYCEWITRSLEEKLEPIAPGISSQVMLINNACQRVLPIPTNHIIFSPPYAHIMAKKLFSEGDISKDIYGEGLTEYS